MSRDCIVILTPGFPGSEDDSTCLPPIQQFCLCVQEQFPDLRVVIVTMQYPFKRSTYLWHGFEVHAAGGSNRKNVLRLLTWLRTWRILKQVRSQYKPDAVLSLWLGESALIGKRFAKQHHLRHLIWLQGQDAKKENRYVKRVRPDPASVVAISTFNANELQRNHGIKVKTVVQNGLNTRIFPQFNNGDRDIDILGVGALIPFKNYDVFVQTVYELKKQHPQVRAVLAGEGSKERELALLVTTLGLDQNLKLIGSVPHRQILDLMNRSRIFLHPSSYEGHSTVLLEALYSGCATISRQPVADGTTESFFLCGSNEEMADKAKQLFPHTVPKQILVNDMRQSARKLVNALLGK